MLSDLDGILVQTADGKQYAIFDPKWWQVWRWIGYWLSEDKGRVLISVQGQASKSWRCRRVD